MLKVPEIRSPAADNLPPFLLKTGASRVLSPPLPLILFTQTAISLTWPVSWKSAYITPLHKSASKADIKNYRGISILPRIFLIMEKILFNFVYEKIRHKLSDCHHGFRSRRGTFTLLLDYVDKLFYFTDKIEDSRCVYLDFKKAFDSVSHNRFFFKLEKLGFDKKFVHLISSYLSDRNQHVRIRKVLSSPCSFSSGVPLWSNSRPIFFFNIQK